jgi:hypothetical protein
MTSNKIVTEWLKEFTERIRTTSGSTKTVFSYSDAVQRSMRFRTDLDEVLIWYLKYINSNPLNENDYYKYVEAYRNGKELDEKYFRHSVDKLRRYYAKADADIKYNPFSISNYQDYVLFMMLKLKGVYKDEYDEVFNVKEADHRQYTPLSKTPSVLRGSLPFKVKEYDIARAYPTFIDRELEIKDRTEDVYTVIDKIKFNTLLNMHHKVKGADIETVRSQLKPVYGNAVADVITDNRYNNKGRMFSDMVVYEAEAIQQFVTANEIQNFVRLHDGIFVLENTDASIMKFDDVLFTVKECSTPAIDNEARTFYKYNKENKLITTPKQYADFFEQENFIRGCEDGNDKLIIFQDTNNVVSPFNHKTETVKYLKTEINELHTDEIENRIARESATGITQGYLLLPSKPIEYYTDRAKVFGLPFKNGFFKYDAKDQGFEQMEYSKVNGFFAPHRTQKHQFTECDNLSEFQLFLTMVSTGKDSRKEDLSEADTATLQDFCMMFGYLCHTYKNHSMSPAIILSDDGANDLSRNGGRGKTIFANAIQHVQPSMLKGGREFNPSYIHNFADLKSDTRVYILDDVPAGFKYDDLYTNIVGSISCQRKGTEAVEIPFSKAPKFVITTNWAVRYDEAEASTNRRFFEYKFTDFFNIDNTPLKVFGHTLFDDWDLGEWNRFYNFVYYCVGTYLNNDFKRIEYDKSKDNYRAIFSNDVTLNEFERIFQRVKDVAAGFNVSDFLTRYDAYDNPLRHQKLFSHKNLKTFITTYIKQNNLPITYSQRERRWINDALIDCDEFDL